jgi:hypothetical protein
MASTIPFRRTICLGLGFVATLGLTTVYAEDGPPTCGLPEALRTFETRVENYVSLHRYWQESLPPMNGVSDIHTLKTSPAAVATALRSARVEARQGNIFAPPVALGFDCLIAAAVQHKEAEARRSLFEGLINAYGVHPRVNDTYGDNLLLDVPYFLRIWLPPVPGEIEYRVFERDLVLWDIYAETVIDFLPNTFRLEGAVDE